MNEVSLPRIAFAVTLICVVASVMGTLEPGLSVCRSVIISEKAGKFHFVER